MKLHTKFSFRVSASFCVSCLYSPDRSVYARKSNLFFGYVDLKTPLLLVSLESQEFHLSFAHTDMLLHFPAVHRHANHSSPSHQLLCSGIKIWLRNPPQNESPAPVVSTASVANPLICSFPSVVATSTPSLPSVMAISSGPMESNSSAASS